MINERYDAFIQGKIVAVCEAVLSGEIGIISGSRKLTYLSHLISDYNLAEFMIFIAVESETDHLPVDLERRNWSIEALERKDKEIAEYENDFKEDVFSACKTLIKRFSIYEKVF